MCNQKLSPYVLFSIYYLLDEESYYLLQSSVRRLPHSAAAATWQCQWMVFSVDYFLPPSATMKFKLKFQFNMDKFHLKEAKRARQIPEALSAFRTITTMLSLIQSVWDTAGNVSNADSSDKPELTILDVFAALTIRHHGVVALTAKPDRSTDFQVLATADLKSGDMNHSQPSSTPSQSKKRWPWEIHLTQNPRDRSVERPTVVDPEAQIPKHLKDAGSDLLKSFLTYEWWVPSNHLILACFEFHTLQVRPGENSRGIFRNSHMDVN